VLHNRSLDSSPPESSLLAEQGIAGVMRLVDHSPVDHSPVVRSPVVRSPVVRSPVVRSPVVRSPVVRTRAGHSPVRLHKAVGRSELAAGSARHRVAVPAAEVARQNRATFLGPLEPPAPRAFAYRPSGFQVVAGHELAESLLFQGPQVKFQGPQVKFQVPQVKFQVPQVKFQVPQVKFQGQVEPT
jgi:hypothetical protein